MINMTLSNNKIRYQPGTTSMPDIDDPIVNRDQLVLIPNKMPIHQRDVILNFCKLYEIPTYRFKQPDQFVQRNELYRAYQEYEPGSIIIVGDPYKITGNYYRTMFGRHYTDNVFQDPQKSGTFTTPVGRVFGDTATILDHLLFKTGDSNEAIVILPRDSKDNELAMDGINQLGLDISTVHEYKSENHDLFKNAEVIFQFSNSGSENSIIHGTLHGWQTMDKSVMSTGDLFDFTFDNYPLVFAQACNTGNFGSFARYVLNSRACFLGSSSPTFSFGNVDFNDWANHRSSDGWKIGFLDMMDEKKTIGDIKLAVENRYLETLDSKLQTKVELFLDNQLHDLTNLERQLMVIFQYQLFGNPLRFTPVGIDPDFDVGDRK